MTYFNETAYKAWYRQYQVNLGNFINQLNAVRLRIDSLPEPGSRHKLEHSINIIYEKFEKVIPRDFSEGAKPLDGPETFAENLKVLSNLILKIFNRPAPFIGIYKAEKDKVMKIHHEFHFKEKLNEVKNQLETLEAKLLEPSEFEFEKGGVEPEMLGSGSEVKKENSA